MIETFIYFHFLNQIGDKKMRRSLFTKAVKLLKENKVVIEEETENAIFLKVDENNVRLWYKAHTLLYNCTCKYGSLITPKERSPCSHIIASLLYLSFNTLVDENNEFTALSHEIQGRHESEIDKSPRNKLIERREQE